MRKLRLREGKVFVHDQQLTLTLGSQTLPQKELSLGPPRNAHNAPVMVVGIFLLFPMRKMENKRLA